MDFETIAAIVFLILLTIFVYLKRKNLDTKQIIPYILYFSLYRTKIGISLMDSAAKKFRKIVQYLGYFGIFIGFLGMVFICFFLIKDLIPAITKPEAAAGVGLVLPIKAKGIFYVPFFYWIISIFVIAVVHEFSHGLVARAHNLKVKSSGFAFLGLIVPIIPAAFVEPDEKELRKRSYKEQLSVFAAGPLSNIITAFVFLAVLSFVMVPLVSAIIEPNGVKFSDYYKSGNRTYPAENAGISVGENIHEIDGRQIVYIANMTSVLGSKKPGDIVEIKTDKSDYRIKLEKNPGNESAAFMGISQPEQSTKIKDSIKAQYGELLPNSISWTAGLFIFLYILNLGIGLFNLVPIGPLDGGRMLQLPLHKYFGEKRGNRILAYVSLVFFIIILMNVGAGFGLFKFLS